MSSGACDAASGFRFEAVQLRCSGSDLGVAQVLTNLDLHLGHPD